MAHPDEHLKGEHYERVIRSSEHADVMTEEYCVPMRLVSRSMPFRHHLTVLNLSAAGAELTETQLSYLPCDSVTYVEVEIDEKFCAAFGKRHCPLGCFPFESESVDVVFSIAGVHHFSPESRALLYAECRRVLRPDGMLVVGDVKAGSAQAAFLNGFVDANSSRGHRGMFFDENGQDASVLRRLFAHVECGEEHYVWRFRDVPHSVSFCHSLFGIDGCDMSETASAMSRIFGTDGSDGSDLPWMLYYFQCFPSLSSMSL